jgi:predicted acetyltransferase
MTSLLRPDVRLHESWAATVRDFLADGGLAAMHGSGSWRVDGIDPTEAGCAAYVAMLRDHERPAADSEFVPSTFFWIADDDADVIGFLHLRHALNDFLLEEGGHVGYSVRPARRREGHARRALALALREAAALGIDRVLVTCDDDNPASRRTIEAGGGVLEDVRHGTMRFWVAVD